MSLLDHSRRKLSDQVVAFTILVLAFFVMASGLLWIADATQPTYDKVFSEIVIRPEALYIPSLPLIPTERETAMALDLTGLHPQRTPEETVAVFKAILNALVQNRGKLGMMTEEEAPGVLHLKRSSASYVD